jgi:signal transduction histidine kinase/HAMP domain-containing protein
VKRRITVAGLLGRAFAALVVLIVMSGVAGIGASVLQLRSLRELSDHVVPLRLATTDFRSVMTDAQRSIRGYLLTGDLHFLAQYDSAAAAFGPAVRRMRVLATMRAERTAIEDQVTLAGRWWRHGDRQRRLPPRSDAAAAAAEAGVALFDPVLDRNGEFAAALDARGAAIRERGTRIQTAALGSLGALTGVATLVAVLTALRTTGRITRPLRRLVTVLDRLGGGNHDARAAADVDLIEIAGVAGSVNALADEADRVRRRETETSRLAEAMGELGTRIRQHLSVDASMDEATAGLGRVLDADHVVVRLAGVRGPRRGSAGWSRTAGPGAAAVGGTEPLAGLPPDWLTDGRERTYVWNDVSTAGTASDAGLPAEELSALRAAGAASVLTVPFSGGTDLAGAVTLIRCADGATWTDQEVRSAETVVAELNRGLQHARLYEREQDLVAQLQDLDNAKTDFMSTVSHELRTPLTSIAGYLEMLTDGDAGELNAAQRRMLGVIDRNTVRLRSLIEDLLVLSRIESGTLSTSKQPIEFGWMITSAVAAIVPTAVAAGVTIETDVGAALAGDADPGQIDRVLMNLLSNAVKFTPPGGMVRVFAVRDGGEVTVRVSDTGMGIPEAEQRHLFDRFFRASNATDQAIPGTGLGLAIVRTIVAQHGGSISLESKEGQGTSVTVRLPA